MRSFVIGARLKNGKKEGKYRRLEGDHETAFPPKRHWRSTRLTPPRLSFGSAIFPYTEREGKKKKQSGEDDEGQWKDFPIFPS